MRKQLTILILFFVFNLGFSQQFQTFEFTSNGWMGQWNISSDDVYLPFDPLNLFAVSNGNNYAGLLTSLVVGTFRWSNGGNNHIGDWSMASTDGYVSFHWGGYDRLLTTNPNGWAMVSDVIDYYPYVYHRWSNNGNHWVGNWNLNNGDRFIPGDFDDQYPGEEILAVRASSGWAMLLRYSEGYSEGAPTEEESKPSSSLYTIWSNGGNGQIAGWNLNVSDRYVSGSFINNNKQQLFIAKDPYATIFTFNGSDWTSNWYNNGNDWVGNWNLKIDDKFIAGKFNGDVLTTLVPIHSSGWAMKLRFNGSTWITEWSNGGSGWISGWHIGAGDKYVVNDWKSNHVGDEILCVYDPYAALVRYALPPPPQVTITGPTSLGYKQHGTWEANASGGNGIYTYEWRYRYYGTGNWSSVVGTSRTYSRTMLWDDFELQVKVTSAGSDAYDRHYVEYEYDSPQVSGRITKSGNIEPTDLPEEYDLYPNYPNPFNPSTTIGFQLPESKNIELSIYSLDGQKIATLVNGIVERGIHKVEWNGRDDHSKPVASGVYVYQLKAGDQRFVKKMIYVK